MQRERLTITLDTELLKAVDATVDRSAIRNRSHAIEHAIREGLALRDITHAVLALTPEGSLLLPQLLERLSSLPIETYVIVAPAGSMEAAQETARSVTGLTGVQATVVPGDFGTGAALLLNRHLFKAPFVYALLNGALSVPGLMLPAYVHHRRNPALVSRILTASESGALAETGVSLISPDILSLIPAGIASLEGDVFPGLAKAGRIGAYVTEQS